MTIFYSYYIDNLQLTSHSSQGLSKIVDAGDEVAGFSVIDHFLLWANNFLSAKALNSTIGTKRRRILKFIESFFTVLEEAGECPNLENEEWKIGNCNICFCRNAVVYCESTCAGNQWFKVRFFFCLIKIFY